MAVRSRPSTSTFTGPDAPSSATGFPNAGVPNASTPANSVDTLPIHAMAQNQYSNTTPSSPNGGAYQLTLQNVGYDFESGKLTDLQAGLEGAAHQIDTDIAQAQ